MESISLKLDSALAREISMAMKFAHYSTKTEFIREAIRKRLAEINEEKKKEKAWQALFAARGIFKDQAMTDKEFYRKRKEYGEQFAKELEKEFGLKH